MLLIVLTLWTKLLVIVAGIAAFGVLGELSQAYPQQTLGAVKTIARLWPEISVLAAWFMPATRGLILSHYILAGPAHAAWILAAHQLTPLGKGR